jgi:hypothetical protein
MSTVMTFIHRSGWANADMIRALGSLATRSYDNALFPGLLIHFAAGVVFAFPYVLFLRTLGEMPGAAVVGGAAAMGLFHGVAMAFVLLALVADNHPVERFRKVGPEVAAAHVVGHVAYGLGVGLMCVALLR